MNAAPTADAVQARLRGSPAPGVVEPRTLLSEEKSA
jgi:hypothetical protein